MIHKLVKDLFEKGKISLSAEWEEERFRLLSALEVLGIPHSMEYHPEKEEAFQIILGKSEVSLFSIKANGDVCIMGPFSFATDKNKELNLNDVPQEIKVGYEDEPVIQDVDLAPQELEVKEVADEAKKTVYNTLWTDNGHGEDTGGKRSYVEDKPKWNVGDEALVCHPVFSYYNRKGLLLEKELGINGVVCWKIKIGSDIILIAEEYLKEVNEK